MPCTATCSICCVPSRLTSLGHTVSSCSPLTDTQLSSSTHCRTVPVCTGASSAAYTALVVCSGWKVAYARDETAAPKDMLAAGRYLTVESWLVGWLVGERHRGVRVGCARRWLGSAGSAVVV